ncbi:hypothetical protein [Neomegalonema perideroedes]|uniref:hypothetical protein n=1 Tax=Neomegalonema perideroedes TaxID=217219 RepID=UPI00036705ED|nr:hypothetical protein [Neomegalonema perideroedes]
MIEYDGMIHTDAEAARRAGVPEAVVASGDLGAAKAAARARLIAHVAAARAALITNLPGQEMVYLAKEAEAEAWLAARDPDAADYPLLAAEVGTTAETPDQLAQIWLNKGALWREAVARLEALRLRRGAALDAARTPKDVEAAMEGLA